MIVNIINIIGNENTVGQHLRDSSVGYNKHENQAQNVKIAQKHAAFAASNPDETAQLRLVNELKAVEKAFEHKANYTFKELRTIKWEELLQGITTDKSECLHFCGHGSETALTFHDKYDTAKDVGETALMELLTANDCVKMVVLNSCSSAALAQKLSGEGVYAIGTTDALPDNIGVVFSAGFYMKYVAGHGIETCFANGKAMVLGEDENLGGLYELYKDGSKIASLL